MKKIKLTEKNIEDFKLNMAEIEERCDDLNTSIKALYLWADRMGFKYKKRFKIVELDKFRD